MKAKLLLLLLTSAILLFGCDKKVSEGSSPIVVSDRESLTQTVYADENAGRSDVTFTTDGAWTFRIVESVKTPSTCAAAGWLSISPSSGDEAGSYTVKISIDTNFTGERRSAVINIECNGQTLPIQVTQEATDESGKKPSITNPVYSVVVSPREVYLQPGETTLLKAVVYPEDASVKNLDWVSSDPDIATVNEAGMVSAIFEGTAKITVSSSVSPDITDTCIITVKEETPEAPLPAHYVKGINGVEMVFDPQTAHVIGNKSEMFAERYDIEGGTLGGGGPLKSIKGQGREMRFPTEHEYTFEGEYLKRMSYMVGTPDDYDTVIGDASFTWEGDNLTLIRTTSNKSTGAQLIKFEYGDLEQPEGNLNINLYAGLRDLQMLGPHYYVIFDNNLGKHSPYLISKVTVSQENDPDYPGSYERTFRYEFYGELVKEIYYTETRNGITKQEIKLCDFYYR